MEMPMCDYIERREFERVVADHERRLDGHDALYVDVRQTREELVAFIETLRHARKEINDIIGDRDKCKEDCKQYRAGFESRVTALERFRWMAGGAVVLIAAAPAWTTLFLLLTRG